MKDEVQLNENRIDEVGHDIWNQLPLGSKVQPRIYKLWQRIAAAAAMLLVAGAALFFYNTLLHLESARHPELVSGSHDIVPGKNTAIVTLANGKTIQLSDAKPCEINHGKKERQEVLETLLIKSSDLPIYCM